ncbi:MAG: hypothetical protein GWO02_05185 [Gammaproteobacteria bacterium]|nr:hypothetical protein [Gammaproteobacteria bacterium]
MVQRPEQDFEALDHGRLQPFRKLPLALDSAQPQSSPLEVELKGTFLYLDDDTTGKVYVRFNDRDSARIPVQAGFAAKVAYARLFLDWTAQSGLVANIVHGFGIEFAPTNDIANIGTLGSIASPVVLERPVTRSLTGEYFIGAAWMNPGADFVHLQLFNPAGSGVRLVVERMMCVMLVDGSLHVRAYDVDINGGANTASRNKHTSQAAPAGKLNHTSSVSYFGTQMTAGHFTAANRPVEFVGHEPLVLDEGDGVVVTTGTSGISASAFFEWREVST